MNFRYLEAFYWVGKELSFSRAAERLRIAPSAVTRQIKLFEDSCGRQLLIRSPKSVVLTREGLLLHKKIALFFSDLREEASMKVRLGCLQSVFEGRLRSCLSRHAKQWREHLQDISIGSPQRLFADLKAGRLDIILTNRRPLSKEFNAIAWGTEGYRIVSKHAFSLKDLEKQDWIVISAFEPVHRSLKIEPESLVTINSFNAGLQLIHDGWGVGVVPESARFPAAFHSVPVPTRLKQQALYIVTLQSARKSPVVEQLIKSLLI